MAMKFLFIYMTFPALEITLLKLGYLIYPGFSRLCKFWLCKETKKTFLTRVIIVNLNLNHKKNIFDTWNKINFNLNKMKY